VETFLTLHDISWRDIYDPGFRVSSPHSRDAARAAGAATCRAPRGAGPVPRSAAHPRCRACATQSWAPAVPGPCHAEPGRAATSRCPAVPRTRGAARCRATQSRAARPRAGAPQCRAPAVPRAAVPRSAGPRGDEPAVPGRARPCHAEPGARGAGPVPRSAGPRGDEPAVPGAHGGRAGSAGRRAATSRQCRAPRGDVNLIHIFGTCGAARRVRRLGKSVSSTRSRPRASAGWACPLHPRTNRLRRGRRAPPRRPGSASVGVVVGPSRCRSPWNVNGTPAGGRGAGARRAAGGRGAGARRAAGGRGSGARRAAGGRGAGARRAAGGRGAGARRAGAAGAGERAR